MDFKRNNKIALRCFSESQDFHDIVKTLLVRMLRRKHKDAFITTEFNGEIPNKTYPDIFMQIKNQKYVWEIQKEYSENWQKKIELIYLDFDITPITIKLKHLEKKWLNSDRTIVSLRKLLGDFAI